MTTVRFDLPTPEGDTIAFWEAAKEERLLVKHCLACDAFSYYPRPFCPKCWSEQVEWYEASGEGTLYTWSVIYSNDMPPFRDRVPYVAAIVDLAEGPRMMTNVVDCSVRRTAGGHGPAGHLPTHLRRVHDSRLHEEARAVTAANDAVIVAATRTPIGRSGRTLAGLAIADIGMHSHVAY